MTTQEAIEMNVQEEIRKLAYDFYEKTGKAGGMELEHWLKAEQIVMARLAAQEKVEAAEMKPEKPQKTARAATVSTKPKRTQSKTGAKPVKKAKKPKG
jgi:Protein of unknown function (DUF2934)